MSDFPRLRDTTNRRLTSGLFYEFRTPAASPVWTISSQDRIMDGVLYPSFHRLYIETLDPTDISFVDKYLHRDLEHFELICSNPKLKFNIDHWREEVALRLQSIALKRLTAAAPTSQKDALQAAKYLGSRAWEGTRAARGRPKKQQVAVPDDVSDDFQRVQQALTVVQGGKV